MNAVVPARLATGLVVDLYPGHEYMFTYRLPGQRHDREARSVLLGVSPAGLSWDSGPACGSQEIPASVITGILRNFGPPGPLDRVRYAGRDARTRVALVEAVPNAIEAIAPASMTGRTDR